MTLTHYHVLFVCAVVTDAGDELIVHAERIVDSAVDTIRSVCFVTQDK